MEVQTLIEKRANLWDEAKKFLDDHTDKDGKISAEDAAAYDKMESDIVDLTKNIERYERMAVRDTAFNQPTSKPILPEVGTTKKTGRASNEYKQAFINALRSNFRNLTTELQVGSDQLGGYLVPEELDNRLIEGLNEENIMRQLGSTITTSGERKINLAGTKPSAAWIDEGEKISFTTMDFDQISLGAHKLHVAIKVTNELLYDNQFGLENYIVQKFTEAIANKEEDAFLNGSATATDSPKGLFPMAEADTENVVTTAGAAIASDDIINLVYKLKRPYRKNAAFIMNDAAIAAIRKLKDVNQAYMWQPSYSDGGEPDRLLGYPIYTSQFAPALEAGKAVIAFGDFSYYQIADRGTRSLYQLKELYMENDMTGFLMLERVDGALLLPEAVRVLKMKA